MRRGAIISFDFYPPIGGQGRHTYELWRRLQEDRELELRCFSPLANDLPGHHRVFPLSLRAGRHLAFSLYAGVRLERWRRELGLDFVHLNGGPGGLLLFRRPRGQVIYTVHHTYAQQARLVPGDGWKRLFIPLERASYRKADAVTGDCPSTTATLRNELGVRGAFTVPSGVDRERFRPLGLSRLRDTLLYVGRLDARKGIDQLLRAMPVLLDLVGGARLVIIGTGPLESAVRRLVREGGVEEHVTQLGRVTDEMLVQWYNRASLVVVPSAFEGFGLSVLEAQACGAPVLATDTDGLRDLIEDGVNGRLAPFGRPEKLAQVAAEVLGDDEQRRSLGEAGARSAALYDWDLVAQRWREVYLGAGEGVRKRTSGAAA